MADKGKKILVIDDEQDVRTYLTTLLEDNGYCTDSACDGNEALTKVNKNRPDLITLDITMPEKSGVKFYRDIKENPDLKKIPIIIVTGIAEDFKKFISSRKQVPPPEGYIQKPIDKKEMLDTVKKLIA